MGRQKFDNFGRRRRTVDQAWILFSAILALLAFSAQVRANPDVYAVLPEDTRVVQYGMGDLDGDLTEELAVLYTSGGAASLALFKADSGHWSLLLTDSALLTGTEGASPSSVEIADVNGDGTGEVLFYYLTGDRRGMVTRVLDLDTSAPAEPGVRILLEDTTVPPGYPLFGFEDGSPSVTFLEMPLARGDTGHRRVYCWDGEKFERCVEVPWEKP